MMTFSAMYSSEAASLASMDFCEPAIASPLPPPPTQTEAPTLTISHNEDLVPAIGGLDTASGDDRVLVRRTLYDDAPIPTGDAFPSHDLGAYRETAGLVDASKDRRVEKFIDDAAPFLSGTAPGTATEYRATRVER
jgi:hypothetical protein